MKIKEEINALIMKAADNYVFNENGHKWSNNNNTAGDNYGSFIAGCNYILKLLTDKQLKYYESRKSTR